MSDHIDGTLAAANRAIELAAENERLKAKLAEHELLFGHALTTEKFLEDLLAGLAHQLPPGTPRTVEGIVDEVARMYLALDAHEDASTPAFDEIAKLCGCPQWDYPGQIVRDVERLVQERDFWKSQTNALTPAYVTMQEKLRVAEVVRDEARAASNRYIDEKRAALEMAEACREDQRALATRRDELLQVIARLSNTVPFPDEWKDWESTRAKLVAEVGTMRHRVATLEDLAKEAHVETIRKQQLMLADTNWLRSAWDTEIEKNKALTKQKDEAYGERDRCVAAIAALAVRLGWNAWLGKHVGDPWDHDWRNIVFVELPSGQVSWHIHDSEVQWFSFLSTNLDRKWDGHTTAQKYERIGVALHAIASDTRPGCPDCGSNLDRHLRRAAEEALKPDSPSMIAYNRVYEVMGNEGTADERRDLFWRTVREVRDGTFKPTLGERAWMPSNPVTTESPGQCPWILPDEDPDEGYWHCKLGANHAEKHVTEFGKGIDGRWYMPCEGDAHTFVGDACRDCGYPVIVMGESEHDQYDRATGELGAPLHQTLPCSCSPKYIEFAPGVHAKYCALGGLPLDDGRKRSRCEPCDLTFRAAVGDPAFDTCVQCGKPTTAVSP